MKVILTSAKIVIDVFSPFIWHLLFCSLSRSLYCLVFFLSLYLVFIYFSSLLLLVWMELEFGAVYYSVPVMTSLVYSFSSFFLASSFHSTGNHGFRMYHRSDGYLPGIGCKL